MKTILSISIVTLALAGCATQEQRIADASALCVKLGYTVSTAEHRDCTAQQYAQDERNRIARAQAAAAINSSIQQSRPRTCSVIGNTVQCY